MLDTYVRSGDTNLKINAVAGTLVKNHPKSRFVVANKEDEIFNTNPCLRVASTINGRYYSSYEPCVVLQAMIISDGLFLCEVILESDFNNGEI